MATDYWIDVRALDDLPDPEELTSGDENVGYALGRRLLQPADALEEVGDQEECDALDLRDYLGETLTDEERETLESRITRILSQDERVASVDCTVTFTDGGLDVEVNGEGIDGPFSFVLNVADVSSTILTGG